jgi:Ca2+-binding EF-hand superfamily protein
MRWRIFTAAGCLCAITACISAYAQNDRSSDQRQSNQQSSQTQANRQRSNAQQIIQRHDENGDGTLQRSELPQDMRSNFSQLDRDQNGKLSASELRAHSARKQRGITPVEVVCVWVSDADQGRLSVNELQTAYDTLLDLDENNDQQISRREVQQRRQEIASRWSKQVVNRLDQDDDGMVDQDEAKDSFMAGNFDQIDNNSDGSVSRQELQRSVTSNRQDEQPQSRSAQRSQNQRSQDQTR